MGGGSLFTLYTDLPILPRRMVAFLSRGKRGKYLPTSLFFIVAAIRKQAAARSPETVVCSI